MQRIGPGRQQRRQAGRQPHLTCTDECRVGESDSAIGVEVADCEEVLFCHQPAGAVVIDHGSNEIIPSLPSQLEHQPRSFLYFFDIRLIRELSKLYGTMFVDITGLRDKVRVGEMPDFSLYE